MWESVLERKRGHGKGDNNNTVKKEKKKSDSKDE